MRRVLAVAAIVTVLTASPAVAGTWSWGYDYLDWYTSTGNGCYYSSGEVCSGWNYWFDEYIDKRGGGRVLAGYENGSTIRGVWLDGAVQRWVTPGEVGMGGYLRAHATYWYGEPSYLQIVAYA